MQLRRPDSDDIADGALLNELTLSIERMSTVRATITLPDLPHTEAAAYLKGKHRHALHLNACHTALAC